MERVHKILGSLLPYSHHNMEYEKSEKEDEKEAGKKAKPIFFHYNIVGLIDNINPISPFSASTRASL